MKGSLFSLAVGAICACLYAAQSRNEARFVETLTVDELLLDRLFVNDGRYAGFAKPKGDIVEFFDYECPPCREESQRLKAGLLDLNKREITLLLRHFPLPIHKSARDLAERVETTVDPETFLARHFEVMDSGLRISGENNPERSRQDAPNRAIATSRVLRDESLAKGIGLSSTPSYIVRASPSTVRVFHSLAEAIQSLSVEKY